MAKHFHHRAQQYSRQKKIAFSIPGFSAHTTNIFSSAAKSCSVLAVRAENAPEKHFLSALHTAVFTATFSGSLLFENYSELTVSSSTIFLRVCFPGLPTLDQVPPVYSRLSLQGFNEPFHSRRLYTSVTAHSRVSPFQVFSAPHHCLFPFYPPL